MSSKGMRRLLFRSMSRSSSSPSLARSSSSSSSFSLSGTDSLGRGLVSDRISDVESIIGRWESDPDTRGGGRGSGKIASLFHGNRDEVRLFLRAVADLNHFMQFLKTADLDGSPPSSARQQDLLRVHRLLETAMKRLQKEFLRILSTNRERLDSDSVRSASTAVISADSDDEDPNVNSSSEDDYFNIAGAAETVGEVERLPAVAMTDLRSIANCMVSNGYAKECVDSYITVRKSMLEQAMYRLGFQRLTHSQIEKLDATTVDQYWIRNWLTAARVVVKTLFAGERTLCDFVFRSSEHIKESCFAEIARDAAGHFLEFPELVAVTSSSRTMIKRKLKSSHSHSPSPERIYFLLDLHNCITDLLPDIEKVFSYHATCSVRAHALSSLQRLGDCVRYTLANFERLIQKDKVKEPPIPGGGVHPLTCRVMDVLVLLADYSLALDDIYADQPLPNIEVPVPSSSSSSVSARFAWLVLVLLCKLDGKAEQYKDMALSYLFLANNVRYVVKRVSGSKSLRELLGEEWLQKHDEKARSFSKSHVRLGWTKMAAGLEEENVNVLSGHGHGQGGW